MQPAEGYLEALVEPRKTLHDAKGEANLYIRRQFGDPNEA